MGGPVLAPVSAADIIVLNKIDLVPEPSAAATLGWLARIVPGARVLPARNASLPPEVIMGRYPEPRRHTAQTELHDHQITGYATLSLEIDGPRDADRLAGVLADP